MDYLTPEKMRKVEADAIAKGLDVASLMENAGREVAKLVLERYVGKFLEKQGILVVCGLENIGGDGFVAARELAGKEQVRVLLLAAGPSMIKTPEARANFDRLIREPVELYCAGDVATLPTLPELFQVSHIIIDAIFGTEIRGEIREPMASAIRMINNSDAIKVSIDLPSGLDPASGEVADGGAVRADLTVALHGAKVSLRGREEYTGEIVVVPIGISDG